VSKTGKRVGAVVVGTSDDGTTDTGKSVVGEFEVGVSENGALVGEELDDGSLVVWNLLDVGAFDDGAAE
jgi:hypothetical protein